MASSKERQRWERQFDAVTARMNRQRDMLSRAMALQIEASAALFEIAEISKESHRIHEWEDAAARASARAREAIERMAEMSAGIAPAVEESDRQFDADMKEATDG